MTGKEIWKDIYPVEKFIGYQTDESGNIRCCRDFHGGFKDSYRPVRPLVDKDGYLYVWLSDIKSMPRKQVIRKVHRIVAETFLGPRPGMVVNHKDTNKLNNHISNLEWVTAEQNSTLAAQAGLYKTRPVEIIETGEKFDSIKKCAEAIHVHPSEINHYFSGRNSHVKGFHFKYIDEECCRKTTDFLFDYQLDAVRRLNNGNILCGGVGSGKSRTSLFWYFKECGGWITKDEYTEMTKPKDLYIITTAKKVKSLEWHGELGPFLLYPDENGMTRFGNKVIINSWNQIGKYVDVKDSIFILDEQRLVSYGSWTKSFLKIAKSNKWILLSATPGDSYIEYLPVFLANGFFKNKTEFNKEHVKFARYTNFPKIEGYYNTSHLDYLRSRILVTMDYKHDVNPIHIDIPCGYNTTLYKSTIKNRWDYFKDEPLAQASSLCYALRKIVNTDESRQVQLLAILEKHPRVIIFYNFTYELEILKNLAYGEGVEVAEYNGQKHQDIPSGDKWVYLCQYTACSEGWSCIKTNCIVFYSQNYSYKIMTQAAGRIDRLTTPYYDLYYYHLKSKSGIDLAISKALKEKKKFNERRFAGWN